MRFLTIFYQIRSLNYGKFLDNLALFFEFFIMVIILSTY